jgi:hypothetical protein
VPSQRLRPLLIVIFASVAVALVLALRQTSMFDDDRGPSHAATEIVVQVRTQGGRPASAAEAHHLWSQCTHIPDETISQTIDDGTIRGTLIPALGDDVQRRFIGCLEDLTVQGILGQVESVRAIPVTDPELGDPGGRDASGHGAATLSSPVQYH